MTSGTSMFSRRTLTIVLATGAFVCATTVGATAGAAPLAGGHRAVSRASFVHPHTGARVGTHQLPTGVPTHGSYAFLLRLDDASTLDSYRAVAPSHGRAARAAAARTQLSRIKQAQSAVVASLPAHSRMLYRAHSVIAAVAVRTDVHNFAALQGIRGVQAVYPIAAKKLTNSYAVPLVHAPQVWASHGNDLGQNSTIAVIDSGIDYTHANFGGPGTTAAYASAKATDSADPVYPDPAKVIGGTDFVGDSYDPDPTLDDGSDNPNYQPVPAPDNNPLDCEGHGSHVAGIAAGYGENAGGTTFAGDYTTLAGLTSAAYQSTFRIGPGMAPEAKLLAYKVFGCEGSTEVIGQAMDAAADPNGDGDPSDHADVINMSLGSDYSSPQDGDSVAADVASQLGITVVVASGNSGDQYDVGGSPGDAVRTIAVANSVDAYSQIDSLHATVSGTPQTYGAQRSDAYDWSTNPDLAGTVVALSTSTNLDGCDALTPGDAARVTGKIAFLDWTDNDDTRRCGSATRSKNVVDAGAIGAILADDSETFSAGIVGSDVKPVVMVVKSAGDILRAALAASSPVAVTSTTAGDFVQSLPGDNDKLNTSSSRGIRSAGGVKPDVAAVGTSVFSTAVGTGDQGISFSGTSMATPMVAGLAALVRSVHKDWTPEQVKADIMNTSGQDVLTGSNHTGTKFAPNRVGAGRIQADMALDNHVLAYVHDDPGAVSVSFGPLAITAATKLTKTVDVVNTGFDPSGAHDASFTVAYQPITTVPGVSYVVSPTSLTVPANSTRTFTVQLVVTSPSSMTKTHDATLALTQGGLAREFLADASGRVVLTPTAGSTVPLRVPVYSSPRPASTTTQASSLTLPGSGVQSGSLTVSGHGVNQGSAPAHVGSFVAGFELQAKSGLAPVCASASDSDCVHYGDERSADLKYVGFSSDSPLVTQLGGDPVADGEAYFSITTQKPWRTPVGVQEFDVLIDTNGDDKPDAIVYNTRLNSSDVFLSELLDITDPDPANWFVRDDELINDRLGSTDTALFDSDTLVLPVWLAALGANPTPDQTFPALPGFSATHTRIRYGVLTYGESGVVDSYGAVANASAGVLTSQYLSADLAHPGVEVYNDTIVNPPTPGLLLNSDQSGQVLTVRRDVSRYNADKALGAVLVHFDNAVGSKAKLVMLKTAPKVTLKLADSTITLHHTITATVTVSNTAGFTATGKVNLRHLGFGVYKSGTLSGGKVTITFTPSTKGTFKVRAEYAGDTNYAAGNSSTLSFTVS